MLAAWESGIGPAMRLCPLLVPAVFPGQRKVTWRLEGRGCRYGGDAPRRRGQWELDGSQLDEARLFYV
jgi:hypothetical protein